MPQVFDHIHLNAFCPQQTAAIIVACDEVLTSDYRDLFWLVQETER
jgi:hypothetical protein